MTEIDKDSLDQIIRDKSIMTVFQPIISLRDGTIFGHEARSRVTCHSSFSNIELLFESAAIHNRLWDLELLCRTTALETAYKFMIPPYDKKLFLNVDPNIMHDESFKKGFTKGFLDQYQIIPGSIIFEITERNVIKDFDSFVSTVEHYKGQDYRIAIDDAGAGYSGLNLISEIRPHFIKLDMKLIRGIDTDHLKFALVKGMVEVSKVSDILLIAEGIETHEELETLIRLGVQYGQGYLIQKPLSDILSIDKDIQKAIHRLNLSRTPLSSHSNPHTQVSLLSTLTDTVHPKVKVSQVYDFFTTHNEHFGLCVVEDDIPVGIITPEKLALKLSGQYGYTLNQNKPVSEIMEKDFLEVPHHMTVKEVSSMAMSRPSSRLYEFIVVTESGRYSGTVTIKDLLQKSTELEITTAKHQNPLTGLPGNLIIEQQLNEFLSDLSPRSLAYFDIDNSKSYNDCYGFEKGDTIILRLAKILSEGFPGQFIGHIGGDDFIVLLDRPVEDAFFDAVQERFNEEVLELYSSIDQKNGFIRGQNRQGVQEVFPLMSITCVMTDNRSQRFEDVYVLTENLAQKKKKARLLRITS